MPRYCLKALRRPNGFAYLEKLPIANKLQNFQLTQEIGRERTSLTSPKDYPG